MTKADLIDKISKECGVERKIVYVIVESFMHCIRQSLAMKGRSVFLRGFGTFFLKKRASKKGRDISRNETIVIPARCIPYFKPSDSFLDMDKSMVKEANIKNKRLSCR